MVKKLWKRGLGIALSVAMAVTALPASAAMAAPAAAQERAAKPTILVEMERGLVADFTGTVFNGENAVTVTEGMNLFRNNMNAASGLKMSVKFKLADDAGNFTSLLDILNSQNNRQSMSLIVNKNGTVYLMTGAHANGSNVQHKFSNIADGQFHTLDVTVTAETVVFELDGATAEVNVENGSYSTKDFLTAFFGKPTGEFTDWRGNIDAITVGGMHPDTYQDGPSWTDLKGEINEVSVGKYEDIVATGDAFFGMMFADSVNDNNWLFGGGAETQGRFADLKGLRNYIGHFEEYVRGVKSKANTTGMQRHTVNAGKAGRDAAGFAEALADLINRSNPKAVAYLIGAEDYSQGEDGLDAFKESIESILDQALSMKDGQGCAVLQLPHAVNDAAASVNVKLYADAAKEAYNRIASQDEKAGRMILVDHLAQTDNDSFKNTKLTEEGLLNVEGQYEISRQFTKAVCAENSGYASLSGFPSIDTYEWTVQDVPETYLDTMPEVTAYGNRLRVTVKDAAKDAEWKYIVTLDGTEIMGEAAGNPFVISSLPEEAKYSLTVQTKDGKTQYAPVSGVLEDGETAAAPQAEGAIPEKIRALAKDKSKPLTWLFIGDSITHSAVHTRGYDGIAQLFEKYVKEDLGRTDDIVVNTATSGGTVPNTIEYLEYRMSQYKPDIVSIMLGTNDARNRDKKNEKDNFKANLISLVKKIREVNPNAVIIFRSPTEGEGARGWTLDPVMIERMKEAAEEAGNILYIDQYTEWNEGFNAYSYLKTEPYYLGDHAVHPGAAGHVWMTEKFIRECGLDLNTRIANFAYELPYARETSEIEPDVAVADSRDAVTASKAALQAKYGVAGQIGDIEITLTDEAGRTYARQGTLSDDEVTVSGLPGGSYTVTVTANIKGSAAKKVTFAGSGITLEQETVPGRQEADSVIDQILVIGTLDAGEKCGQKIQEAKEAYDTLTDAQKALVPEMVLGILTDAEAKYANLVTFNALLEDLQEKLADTDTYSTDALAKLQDALDEIGDVDDYPAIADLQAAIGKLQAAQEALKTKAEEAIDQKKKEIAGVLDAIKEILDAAQEGNSDYSEESIAQLNKVYAVQKDTVLTGKTLAELNGILTKLNGAKAGLQTKVFVAKQDIASALQASSSINLATDESKYTSDTWNAFVKAYNALKGLTEAQKNSMTAEQLQKLVKDLQTAQAKLVKVTLTYVTGVKFAQKTYQIAKGKSINLAKEITSKTPENAENQTLTWESSDTKIATVSAAGIVNTNKKAAKKTATITVMNEAGVTVATVKVQVMNGNVSKVKAKGKTKLTVKAGKKVTLKAAVSTKGKKPFNKKLKWTSSNTKVAKVSAKLAESMKVAIDKKAKGKTVKITAISTDGTNKKVVFIINVTK